MGPWKCVDDPRAVSSFRRRGHGTAAPEPQCYLGSRCHIRRVAVGLGVFLAPVSSFDVLRMNKVISTFWIGRLTPKVVVGLRSVVLRIHRDR